MAITVSHLEYFQFGIFYSKYSKHNELPNSLVVISFPSLFNHHKEYPRYNSKTGTIIHEAMVVANLNGLCRIANLSYYCGLSL